MIELSRIQRLHITVCSDLKKSHIYIYPITKEEKSLQKKLFNLFLQDWLKIFKKLWNMFFFHRAFQYHKFQIGVTLVIPWTYENQFP